MALNETAPGQFEVLASAFDTDDGLTVKVVGEAFPRVSITSAGVAVGDGTAAPSLVSAPLDASAEDDGDFLLLATVADGEATYSFVPAADYENA